jgi:hypothetical protein
MSSLRDPRAIKRPKLEFTRFSSTVTPSAMGIVAKPNPPVTIKPVAPSLQPPIVPPRQEERPKAVFWDEQGRLLDDKGNILNLKKDSELMINQKTFQTLSKDQRSTRDLIRLKKFGEASSGDLLTKRKFFDPTIELK